MTRAVRVSWLWRDTVAGALGLWLALATLSAWAAERYGPVRPGETLWQIADRVYEGSGLSRDQIMLALLRANPDAFSSPCNLNSVLRVGAVLELPQVDQVAAVDAADAQRMVERQDQEWSEYRRGGRPPVCAAPEAIPAGSEPEAPGMQAEPPGTTAGTAPATAPPSPEPPAGSPGAPPAETAGRQAKTESPPAATPEQTSPAQEPGEPRAGTAPAGPAPPSVGQVTAPEEQPAGLPPSGTPVEAGKEAAASKAPPHAEAPSPQGAPGEPLLSRGEGEGKPLPPGRRAPAWLLTAALLLLVAATLVRWERYLSARRRRRPAAAILRRAARKIPARASLLLAPGRLGLLQLLLLSAVSGFIGALVTVLFREGIHGLEWLFNGQSAGIVVMAESLAPWQRLILPAAGGLVAGLILQQLGGLLRGRSTTDYMEAVAVGDGWISVRHSLVKAGSSLVTVGSGGSIGREGAMVQLAAMVASALGRLGRFPRDRLRLLVAAGAAAGLAAAYNAPIAATLFVAEIVLGSIALEHIGPLIIAAVISNATVHDIFGYAPVYDIPAFSMVSDWELALYLLLGVLAGHVAPVFLSLLERARQLFGRLPRLLALRMALGGLLVGAISVYEPQVWGNGYSVVNSVLHDPWAWQALLTVLVLKMLATAATHGSGAVGGAFTPTLFVGAMVGALFGTAAHGLLPDGTASPSAYAVVGMGAMLGGATHAPLMSILMVFELTMDYQIVLPLMLAVITAHYTARGYSAVRPMYADSLLPREAPA